MATRGRKPKPTAIKLLEGNPGKRPLNTKEPIPPKEEAVCPSWLLPEAQKAWSKIAPMLENLGILSCLDISALAGYCQSYARWKDAKEQVAKRGVVPR